MGQGNEKAQIKLFSSDIKSRILRLNKPFDY